MRVLGGPGAPRRSLAAAAALLGAAGALAGCGGGGQPSQPRPSARAATGTPTASVQTPAPSSPPTALTRPATGFVPATASFPDADNGFAWGVGPCPGAPNTFCPGLAATVDRGSTWKLRAAPTGQPTNPYQRAILRFATLEDGWAVTGGALQVTHDGAASWHDVTLPSTTTPQTLAVATTSTTVYVVATTSGARGPLHLFRSAAALDDFFAVPAVTAPATGASVHLSVSATGGALTVDSATDGSPRLFTTTASGGWAQRSTPCQGGDNTAAAAGTGAAIAVVCDGAASVTGATKTVWLSADLGASFTQVSGPAQVGFTTAAASVPLAPAASESAPASAPSASATAATPAGIFVVAASAGEDRLYFTQNGGRSWSVAYADSSDGSGSGLGWADLAFSDSTHGVAVLGNAGIFVADRLGGRHAVLSPRLLVTGDEGRHWSQTVIR